jgi:hypothetical protein
VATSDGGGYWVTDANGDVYPFGDAGSFGSLPSLGVVPSHPIVGGGPERLSRPLDDRMAHDGVRFCTVHTRDMQICNTP